MMRLQADFEKTYKPTANLLMPRIRNVKYNI
jgi:hypothetical protein